MGSGLWPFGIFPHPLGLRPGFRFAVTFWYCKNSRPFTLHYIDNVKLLFFLNFNRFRLVKFTI